MFEEYLKWKKEHPIHFKLIELKNEFQYWFERTWFGKLYLGEYYSVSPVNTNPEKIPISLQMRIYIRRMKLAGFNPLFYTWYMGEHTLIFSTQKEANKAYQKYEENKSGSFSCYWYGMDDENLPNELIDGMENWIDI